MPTFVLTAGASCTYTRIRPVAGPVQTYLFAHTPSVVLYDCPDR